MSIPIPWDERIPKIPAANNKAPPVFRWDWGIRGVVVSEADPDWPDSAIYALLGGHRWMVMHPTRVCL